MFKPEFFKAVVLVSVVLPVSSLAETNTTFYSAGVRQQEISTSAEFFNNSKSSTATLGVSLRQLKIDDALVRDLTVGASAEKGSTTAPMLGVGYPSATSVPITQTNVHAAATFGTQIGPTLKDACRLIGGLRGSGTAGMFLNSDIAATVKGVAQGGMASPLVYTAAVGPELMTVCKFEEVMVALAGGLAGRLNPVMQQSPIELKLRASLNAKDKLLVDADHTRFKGGSNSSLAALVKVLELSPKSGAYLAVGGALSHWESEQRMPKVSPLMEYAQTGYTQPSYAPMRLEATGVHVNVGVSH